MERFLLAENNLNMERGQVIKEKKKGKGGVSLDERKSVITHQ